MTFILPLQNHIDSVRFSHETPYPSIKLQSHHPPACKDSYENISHDGITDEAWGFNTEVDVLHVLPTKYKTEVKM